MAIKAKLGDAREYANATAGGGGDPLTGVAGGLHRFPTRFEEQPLLRVHAHGLQRRDVEKQRIELREAFQETAPLAIALALRDGLLRVRMKEAVERPPIARDLRDAVLAGSQHFPEGVEIGSVRVASTDADDCDGFGGCVHGNGRRWRGLGRVVCRRYDCGRCAKSGPAQTLSTKLLHETIAEITEVTDFKEQRLRDAGKNAP